MKASEHGVKLSSIGQFAWSSDEETFHGSFDSVEEALDEGRSSYPDRTIYVGEAAEVYVHGPDADDVTERLVSSVYDQVGEYAESFLDDVTKEAREELDTALTAVVSAWLTKHCLWPTCYTIVKVKEFPAEASAEKKEGE
ncbi:MAG: hypothetical protein C0467_06050 [Planctomycetaceae bacterium]|nr:hypothetical protein [Planctomycetaceae bacterium]